MASKKHTQVRFRIVTLVLLLLVGLAVWTVFTQQSNADNPFGSKAAQSSATVTAGQTSVISGKGVTRFVCERTVENQASFRVYANLSGKGTMRNAGPSSLTYRSSETNGSTFYMPNQKRIIPKVSDGTFTAPGGCVLEAKGNGTLTLQVNTGTVTVSSRSMKVASPNTSVSSPPTGQKPTTPPTQPPPGTEPGSGSAGGGTPVSTGTDTMQLAYAATGDSKKVDISGSVDTHIVCLYTKENDKEIAKKFTIQFKSNDDTVVTNAQDSISDNVLLSSSNAAAKTYFLPGSEQKLSAKNSLVTIADSDATFNCNLNLSNVSDLKVSVGGGTSETYLVVYTTSPGNLKNIANKNPVLIEKSSGKYSLTNNANYYAVPKNHDYSFDLLYEADTINKDTCFADKGVIGGDFRFVMGKRSYSTGDSYFDFIYGYGGYDPFMLNGKLSPSNRNPVNGKAYYCPFNYINITSGESVVWGEYFNNDSSKKLYVSVGATVRTYGLFQIQKTAPATVESTKDPFYIIETTDSMGPTYSIM